MGFCFNDPLAYLILNDRNLSADVFFLLLVQYGTYHTSPLLQIIVQHAELWSRSSAYVGGGGNTCGGGSLYTPSKYNLQKQEQRTQLDMYSQNSNQL